MSSALRASPWARTIIDCGVCRDQGVLRPHDKDATTHLLLLDGLVDQEGCTERSLLRNLRRREVGSRVSGLGRARTCFASTA